MKHKHTPGPWEVDFTNPIPDSEGEPCEYHIYGESGDFSVAVAEGEGNAHLIAAAPDLLEALKAVNASVICNGDLSITYAIDGKTSKLINNAIAKAEGKTE